MSKSFGRRLCLSLSLWIVWDLTYPNRFLPSTHTHTHLQKTSMKTVQPNGFHHFRPNASPAKSLHLTNKTSSILTGLSLCNTRAPWSVLVPCSRIRSWVRLRLRLGANSTPVARLLRPLGFFRMHRWLQLTLDAKSFLDCYIEYWE